MKGKSSSWGKKVLPKGFSPKHFYLTANEKFFHQTEKNNKRREGKKMQTFPQKPRQCFLIRSSISTEMKGFGDIQSQQI